MKFSGTSGSRKELQNDSTHNVANISTTLFPVKGMTGCETWRLVDLNVPLKMINEVWRRVWINKRSRSRYTLAVSDYRAATESF